MNIQSRTLMDSITETEGHRHRLVVACMNADLPSVEDLIRQIDLCKVNLNLQLSKELLEVAIHRRPRVVSSVVRSLLNISPDGAILVYNIELLFHPQLQLDPLRLFEDISRTKALIVIWNGQYADGVLSYGRTGHPEYRSYSEINAKLLA